MRYFWNGDGQAAAEAAVSTSSAIRTRGVGSTRTMCVLFGAAWTVACGGATATELKAPTVDVASAGPVDRGAPTESEEPVAETVEIPAKCAKTDADGYCLPPARFVSELCDGVYSSVALWMFGPDTPWTRVYLRGKIRAWNASGGASVEGELAFDEEVLVLRHRKTQEGGFSVSGSDEGFDALRWNGACVSLEGGEVTKTKPPSAKQAPIKWNWLEPGVRDSMREDEGITAAYRARRKECKGVTMGDVSRACVKAHAKLSSLVVTYIKSGGSVALPEPLPGGGGAATHRKP